MVCFLEIEGLQVLGEDDDWVADKEVGEVCSEKRVHAAINELIFELLINDKIWIEVFVAQTWVGGDIRAVRCVSGLWDAPAVVFEWLCDVS